MINIAAGHIETIKKILAEFVGGCEVRAFGSRINGASKEHSDLDLAVVGNGKLNRRTKMLLREAFEDSDLPFRVDVIDYNAVSNEFRSIIDKKYEILQKNDAPSV
jgi:uncharacterized protein